MAVPSVKIGVCQGENVVETRDPIPTERYPGVDPLVEAMAEEIAKLREKHDVAAIGVGVPGFVDFEAGYVYNLTNVPGWQNVPLKHILNQRTDLPVVVENDANAMAYAEWKCGAAQGLTNVICITLGTGVGGGLILDGKPYRGSTYGAGEIGQMSIDCDGRSGNYGNLGALEKYIGNQQIEELARKRYANVGEDARPESCTPRHIAEAAGKRRRHRPPNLGRHRPLARLRPHQHHLDFEPRRHRHRRWRGPRRRPALRAAPAPDAVPAKPRVLGASQAPARQIRQRSGNDRRRGVGGGSGGLIQSGNLRTKSIEYAAILTHVHDAMNVPDDLKFASSHEWARLEGDIVTVGISDHAQTELTDIVYLELPEIGRQVEAGEEVAVIESVKSASDIYSPVSGEIVEINQATAEDTGKVNSDPYGDGWMMKIKVSGSEALAELMDAAAYREHAE